MTCSQTDPLIQMALDGRLSSAERAHLDDHLGDCGACRAAWDEYRSLGSLTADWARRPVLTVDSGDAFTSQVMAQITAQSARRPAFPMRRATAWVSLAALVLTALSFRAEPLLQAHAPHVFVPSSFSLLAALAPAQLGRLLASIWRDTQSTWRMLSTYSFALSAWVPSALAVTLCLNVFFAWRTWHHRRETISQ